MFLLTIVPVGFLARQLGKAITVDHNALVVLARMAICQPNYETYMRAHVTDLIEDIVLRDLGVTAYRHV